MVTSDQIEQVTNATHEDRLLTEIYGRSKIFKSKRSRNVRDCEVFEPSVEKAKIPP